MRKEDVCLMLVQIYKKSPTFDNIQGEDSVSTERVDSKKRWYDATGGYMAKAIVDPGQGLPTNNLFTPKRWTA
jgi:hypothetical protein